MPPKKAGFSLNADVFPALDARFKRFDKFKTKSNTFATLVYGHAGKPKVLCYDLAMLVKRGAFLTALAAKGTIFTMDIAVWQALGLYAGISCASAALTYYFADLSGFDYSKLEAVSNYLNMFIPFILGLYVSLALQRWWVLRTDGIGRVMDSTQNLCLILSALLPGKEFQEWHDQVLKYGLASLSLIVQTVRGKENLKSLVEQDHLLTPEEVDILADMPIRPRPAVMWAWTCAICTKVLEEQGVAPGKARDVITECVKARDGISLIWTYLGTQLPFAYVHLVTFLVNLNNTVMSVKCGVVFAASVQERNWVHAMSQIVFVTVVPLLSQGLLSVSYVIHDPFGEDLLDFPVMAYQEYANEASLTFSHYCCRCPALAKDYGPPPSPRSLALRKGQGRPGAERAANGPLSPKFAAAAPRQVAVKTNGADTGDDTDAEVVDSPLLISLREQMRAKDQLITSLQEHNGLLESSVAQVNIRLRSLEYSLLKLPPPPPPPPAPNFCNLPIHGNDRITETIPRFQPQTR